MSKRFAFWKALAAGAVGMALLASPEQAAAERPHLTPLTPKLYRIIEDVAVSPEGRWAVYVNNEAMFIKRVGSRGRGKRIGTANSNLEPLAISAGGKVVVAEMRGGSRNKLVRWTRATGAKRVLARGIDFQFAQTPDGDKLAYVDGRGAVRLFVSSTNTTTLIASAPNDEECDHEYYYDTRRAIAISDDGSAVAYGDCDQASNTIRLALWSARTATSAFIAGTRSGPETPVTLSADGSSLFYMKDSSGSRRHWFRVKTNSGVAAEIHFPVARSQRYQIQMASFSSDGKWVAFAPEVWSNRMNDRAIAKYNSYVWRIGTSTKKVLFKAQRVRGHLVTGYPMNITPHGSAAGVVAHGWDATPGADKAMVAVWRR